MGFPDGYLQHRFQMLVLTSGMVMSYSEPESLTIPTMPLFVIIHRGMLQQAA